MNSKFLIDSLRGIQGSVGYVTRFCKFELPSDKEHLVAASSALDVLIRLAESERVHAQVMPEGCPMPKSGNIITDDCTGIQHRTCISGTSEDSAPENPCSDNDNYVLCTARECNSGEENHAVPRPMSIVEAANIVKPVGAFGDDENRRKA
jgi:hypothetical protein